MASQKNQQLGVGGKEGALFSLWVALKSIFSHAKLMLFSVLAPRVPIFAGKNIYPVLKWIEEIKYWKKIHQHIWELKPFRNWHFLF